MAHIEFIARGVWIEDGRVLLCRNIAGGYWYLPGGHVEHGESAAAALRREFIEETGHSPTVGRPLLVLENVFEDGRKTHHELLVVFHVEHTGTGTPPPPMPSLEPDIAFDWITLAGVVDLDLRPLATRAWLATGGRLDEGSKCGWLSLINPAPCG
ncbi:MAG: NUDIX domain-containing protein [Phycisphaerales bacterium]|nr:NUDIX domain-containing protein [Phycisphaerales bacterium]